MSDNIDLSLIRDWVGQRLSPLTSVPQLFPVLVFKLPPFVLSNLINWAICPPQLSVVLFPDVWSDSI